MIDTRQYRVGNFIQSDGDLFNIDSISDKYIKAGALTVYVPNADNDEIDIPLTADLLEKAGFEYAAGFADDYTKHPITLYNNPFKEGWTVENLFEQQIKDDLLVIQHVHQLQNLYFALTGKELTITL
jgi:hypothetical protein